MTRTAELRRRLIAISDAMQGTFAARFATLNDDERASYQRWRAMADEWYARHERQPGGAYEAILSGTLAPSLPPALAAKLFEPMPTITADMTMQAIADAYQNVANQRV